MFFLWRVSSHPAISTHLLDVLNNFMSSPPLPLNCFIAHHEPHYIFSVCLSSNILSKMSVLFFSDGTETISTDLFTIFSLM